MAGPHHLSSTSFPMSQAWTLSLVGILSADDQHSGKPDL